jgi:PhnB protein
MSAVRAIPEGFHTITPSIVCKNAANAIDFYKAVFQAKEISRMNGPGGSIGHAELQIGDSRLMLSDEFPGMATAPGPNSPPSSYLVVYCENVDALFDRAVKAGAKVEMPLQNQFWGDRYGKIQDPFGHRWGLAQHIEEVSPAEMERRAAAWVAQMSKAAGSAGND